MRNQVFIVFDSLRWDVFRKANAPFLKGLGRWKKAWTPGNYTLPAHMSFFVGKLPQTSDDTDYYDTVATRFAGNGTPHRNRQLWRLDNPEAKRPAEVVVKGRNIIEGFREKGYLTIGTGGVNWFNPELPAGTYLTEPFERFRFFSGPEHRCTESAEEQISWVLDGLRGAKDPYFLFINFGFLIRICAGKGWKSTC